VLFCRCPYGMCFLQSICHLLIERRNIWLEYPCCNLSRGVCYKDMYLQFIDYHSIKLFRCACKRLNYHLCDWRAYLFSIVSAFDYISSISFCYKHRWAYSPTYMPLIWLIGFTLLSDSFYFKIPYSRWYFSPYQCYLLDFIFLMLWLCGIGCTIR